MKVEVDLSISPTAIAELKKFLNGDESESLVRIMLQGGGCGGSSFALALISESDFNPKIDVLEEFDGIKLVVNRESLLMLDGTTIEWEEEPRRGFKFTNAKPKSSCGCKKGKSC